MFGRIKSAKSVAAVAVGVAAVLVLGGGSAVAKTFITGADIKNGSLHLIDLSSSAQSALHGDTGATGATGANGAAGATGATGAKGATGASGATAAKGDTGATGAQGATGPAGNAGAVGPEGDAGAPGANAPAAQYGVATVNVKRGTVNPASAWATYSTLLGSPVGDNTGGTFRFTCSPMNAPCTIGVSAHVTGADHAIYPRLMVYNAGDGNGQGAALTTCEYLDGPATNVTTAATTVGLGAGGTYDCGVNSVTDRTEPGGAGMVTNALVVPAGYYDVHSSFVFLP